MVRERSFKVSLRRGKYRYMNGTNPRPEHAKNLAEPPVFSPAPASTPPGVTLPCENLVLKLLHGADFENHAI